MKRLNLVTFFDLGGALRVLEPLLERSPKKGDAFLPLREAELHLQAFLNSDSGLETCLENARELLQTTRKILDDHFFEISPTGRTFKAGLDFDAELHEWRFHSLRKGIEAFYHVFSAECRQGETYFVEQVAIYHTPSLVNQAALRFHPEIRAFIPPDALREFSEAGKCLAFRLHSAAGFHALRAMEIVMLDYHLVISGKEKKFKSWGECIKALREIGDKISPKPQFPSAKTIAMLDRVRDLDRNPLMHPEDTLDDVTAENLFSVSAATITELARDIKEFNRQKKTALPVP